LLENFSTRRGTRTLFVDTSTHNIYSHSRISADAKQESMIADGFRNIPGFDVCKKYIAVKKER